MERSRYKQRDSHPRLSRAAVPTLFPRWKSQICLFGLEGKKCACASDFFGVGRHDLSLTLTSGPRVSEWQRQTASQHEDVMHPSLTACRVAAGLTGGQPSHTSRVSVWGSKRDASHKCLTKRHWTSRWFGSRTKVPFDLSRDVFLNGYRLRSVLRLSNFAFSKTFCGGKPRGRCLPTSVHFKTAQFKLRLTRPTQRIAYFWCLCSVFDSTTPWWRWKISKSLHLVPNFLFSATFLFLFLGTS